MSLLEIKGLQTYFRTAGEPRKVVDGINLTLSDSETLGVVGESGCGKSLTALSVMNLLPPQAYIAGGSILFKGQDLPSMHPAERRHLRGRNMAMIFQEPMTSLNPVLTVQTQLLEAVGRDRLDTSGEELSREGQIERAIEALRMVEMPEPERRLKEYPHQLSGGMRQRVMIAMALSCNPELLIADEPTTALDVTVEAKILELLRDLQNRLGTAILFITHDLAVVSQIAHRIAVMYAGKIVETAPTETLFNNPSHPYTERLLRCRPNREKRGHELDTIRGIVPSPEDYAPGCRFCDRCPHCFEPCQNEEPLPREVGRNHIVACHLYNMDSPPSLSLTRTSTPQDNSGEAGGDGVLLDAKQVVKHFPIRKGILKRVVASVKAVDSVDLSIPHGSTVALVGESGCGKTTLGKTLIRLLPASSGSVMFEGQDLMAMDETSLRAVRRGTQIVFQDPYSSLDPRMMVLQAIEEGMKIHGIGESRSDRRDRVSELLKSVGLKPEAMNCYPHEFSGGQRQRIGIARALAVEPKFLVLDEPTSALDVSIQAQILNLLQELKNKGKEKLTYLLITHDLSVVEYIADKVAVMYLGRIVEQSPTEQLFDDPKHPYTRALLSAIPKMVTAGKSERILLEGDVPSPINPPQGCHFHPRCKYAMPVCREQYPDQTDLGGGRTARCHLLGE